MLFPEVRVFAVTLDDIGTYPLVVAQFTVRGVAAPIAIEIIERLDLHAARASLYAFPFQNPSLAVFIRVRIVARVSRQIRQQTLSGFHGSIITDIRG